MTSDRLDSALLRRLLSEFLAADTPDPSGVRDLARRFLLLPIYQDTGGLVGLAEGGELVELAWDPPHVTRPVVDARLRRAALALAARDFPELAFLAPVRPAGAAECPHCGGTGRLTMGDAPAPENMLCQCAGLGWLPPEGGPHPPSAGA